MATAYKYQDEVLNIHGDVVPFATITVYAAGTGSLAPLYANITATVPLANPVTADYQGYFFFYAVTGTYDLQISGTGISTRTLTDVFLGAGGSGTSLPGLAVVDGVVNTTIQAALTSASTTGSVFIPSTYTGTDVYTNTNKVQILDLRGRPNRQRGYINMLVDCGLKGDGVTDDAAAAQACFNAYPGQWFLFPTTATSGACSYYFGTTLYPKGEGARVSGASGSFKNTDTSHGGTVLCFAAGVSGIWLDMTPNSTTGIYIDNMSVKGSEGVDGLGSPSKINLPANLPQYTRNISSIQRAANVLTVVTTAIGYEGLTQQVGSTVKISSVVGDTTMNGNCVIATLTGLNTFSENATGFTCAQNGADAGPFGAVGTVSLPTTGASTADGIRICSNFNTLRNVAITGFGRHGVNADSQSGHGCTTNFSDDLVMDNVSLRGNQGNGFYAQGIDSNAGSMINNVFYYNVLWGVEDHSALGNNWIGNQISNNGSQWAVVTTPTTKTISTISRTLTSGISQVSVVLSQADANIKLGSCVVIAGVADTSFNTTAGQCFFVNNYSDSTHYGYEQPGAPANASSSGGTSRMAKFSEVYLAAGVDSGAAKVGTQVQTYSQPWLANYVEGGQSCKFGQSTMSIGGANMPSCVTSSTFRPASILSSTPGTSASSTNINGFANEVDGTNSIFFKAGKSGGTVRHTYFRWYNNNLSADSWGLAVDPSGANGSTGSWILSSGTAASGPRRLALFGSASANGVTRLNSESIGAVQINKDANSGTGGLEINSGGASPSTVATVDATGLGTFNGGVKAGASGSTISDTRELIQTAHSCGTTATCANTTNGSNKAIFGSVALTSATPSTATVTGISPTFTSSSSYFCVGTNTTTQANPIKIANVSGSSFTITGPNTVTDVINYICVGN